MLPNTKKNPFLAEIANLNLVVISMKVQARKF
jgi:hypothetical protein